MELAAQHLISRLTLSALYELGNLDLFPEIIAVLINNSRTVWPTKILMTVF